MTFNNNCCNVSTLKAITFRSFSHPQEVTIFELRWAYGPCSLEITIQISNSNFIFECATLSLFYYLMNNIMHCVAMAEYSLYTENCWNKVGYSGIKMSALSLFQPMLVFKEHQKARNVGDRRHGLIYYKYLFVLSETSKLL